MKYLHTMVRVTDLEASLRFYRDALGLDVLSVREVPQGRFTLAFLAAPGDRSAQVELTYNWDPEAYTGGRNFGHLAYAVDDIYATCARLQAHGVLWPADAAAALRARFPAWMWSNAETLAFADRLRALNAALWGQSTFTAGKANQSNFNRYNDWNIPWSEWSTGNPALA